MRTKTFAELSHDDLLALTDEQVNFYIDLECAEAGVRLMPAEHPRAPDPAVPDVKRKLFAVSGLLFEQKEDAEQVARLASTFRRYHQTYRPGRDYLQWVEPAPDPVGVGETPQVDRHLYETHRLRLDQHTAEMKAYQDAKTEYDQIGEKRAEVHQRIRQRREDARATERRRQAIRGEFERYMELAEASPRVARAFLVKAYADAQQVCPELFDDGDPLVAQPRAIRIRGVAVEEEVQI